ncbi:MAG: hypothetical protein V3T53_01685 [Phycisphaerales bacterium]
MPRVDRRDTLSALGQVSEARNSADGSTAMFIVKPEIEPDASSEMLKRIQRDVHRIVDALPNHPRRLAHEMLEQFSGK